MFNRKQRQIEALEKEIASLNKRMIDAIVPALEQSTLAVTDALKVMERMRKEDDVRAAENEVAAAKSTIDSSTSKLIDG